jgi:hypothetical protein
MKIHVQLYLPKYFSEWEINTVVEKISTRFIFNNFFPKNRAAYEIIWKNMVQPERPQMTVEYGACTLHAG